MSPARPPAARIERATTRGPVFEVVLGVADHDRLAGGAAGGVQAGQLGARHGEQAERVVVAQIRLGHERELAEVGQALQVVRMHALGLALLAVGFDVVVGVAHRPLQALQLQGRNLVAAGGLDRVELTGQWHFRCHGCLLSLWVSAQSACCSPAITSPLMR
jgi:hypothetical protein